MGFRVGAPAPNTGYNRSTDWPSAGGAAAAGGKPVSGLLGQTIGGQNAQWHPTVKYMLVLIVAELVVFHMLSRFLSM